MEYKIRANNQKEAVEVYKAIRQIQQGKHNIAVNANSRKDAVRIYKEAKRVYDSKKVKDSYVEIEGDWDYDAAKAAEKLGLKFKYTGKRYNGYPEARIEGDKQKILTFMRKWYDPDWQLSDIDDSKKVKDFGMHNPATTNYNPEYSPVDFKRYVTNIVKLDLSTKTFTQYNPSKANAIKKLETYVSQVIDDFKADITNPRVIRNEAVTWYNNNYTKILDTLLKTPSIIQHMDGTSLVKANNLLQQMQQSIK